MAWYDLDRYRDFVFEKRLWEAHPIEEKVLKDLEDDDVAMMQFGIEWIKGRLFGDSATNHENTKEENTKEDFDGT